MTLKAAILMAAILGFTPRPLFAATPLTTPAPADDTQRIAAYLAAAPSNGGIATIPPGNYTLDGSTTLPISSGVTVHAYGAVFNLPEVLGDQAKLVLFSGTNVTNFSWYGGEFIGHIFDPANAVNSWEPNVSTRVFVIDTNKALATNGVLFSDIRTDGVAGPVITIEPPGGGAGTPNSWAKNVTVDHCTFLRSGKFCWDYGYLWQQIVWPEEYQPWQVNRALSYFPAQLIRAASAAPGDDRIFCQNVTTPIAVSVGNGAIDAVCFFGGTLPPELTRGMQYFVVASSSNFIEVSGSAGGAPIHFTGTGKGYAFKVMNNLQLSFYDLYQPVNAGPGAGQIDLSCVENPRVTNCALSSLGDLMVFDECQQIVFEQNTILGTRMGAIVLGDNCEGATISGNNVNGTDGSRVLTVDSSGNVTVSGNTFENDGRGSWMVDPVNLVVTGNTFETNTNKNTPSFGRGRRQFITGGWESSPEFYVTLDSPTDTYGTVTLSGNRFIIGGNCPKDAVSFAANGKGITITNNIFSGHPSALFVDPTCKSVLVEGNTGLGQ